MSLRDLADRSGVSAPMLSQVERGETSPTVSVASRIAEGLDLTLSRLFRLDEGAGVHVVRVGERRDGGAASHGHMFEVLTPALPGQRAEISMHVLAPEAATAGPGDIPIHEAGSQESAVVLTGKLRLICDGQAYDLDEGDAVTFDADLPHHFENPGDEDVRFYAVVTAGLKRS